MIAIFAVLGLLLFGGGVYAIFDGWPYLRIERGFTEVIVGSVAIGAGLIMLSLAWVLRQIRALRNTLGEAAAARAEAGLPTALPPRDDPVPTPLEAPAVIGAVAAAVAAAPAAAAGEAAPEPPGDRDLFGALVAQNLQEHEPAAAAAEALPDMFDEALPAPAPAGGEDEYDEFSALRESLASHLEEPPPEAGRIEPGFAPEPDPFAAAEAWMEPAALRREPRLDAEPAGEPAPADEPAPPWPPRTEAPAFDAAPEEPEAQPAADAVEEVAEASAPEAEPEPLVETAAEPAAEPAPAASDEGVIGAYQVGDTHFTLYVDGSIRARTRDGEYSFASMDELKVYLASEKSRLGV